MVRHLLFYSVTNLMASLLNASVNNRRGIRFMESPNKLIKYHQLARPKNRNSLTTRLDGNLIMIRLYN